MIRPGYLAAASGDPGEADQATGYPCAARWRIFDARHLLFNRQALNRVECYKTSIQDKLLNFYF